MNPLYRYVETIMRRDGIAPMISPASLLSIAASFYKMGIQIRDAAYRKGVCRSRRLPCMVISIGNITVGGTGKTPMSIYVASAIRKMGLRVAVLSRGYRGAAEKYGGIVSDGDTVRMDALQAGDEPYLIASKLKGVPVLVGRNRYRTGQIAMDRFRIDVIVLDDGFQHFALARDLDIVLLDDRRPFGNGRLLPRGTLREPISALARSDAFILTRTVSPVSASSDRIGDIAKQRPVFKSSHRADIQRMIRCNKPLSSSQIETPSLRKDMLMEGRPAFAFSGIGGNEDFHHTVRGLGCELRGFLDFPDHHIYSNNDIHRIHREAMNAGADLLLTTEKDYVRIAHRNDRFSLDLAVVGIETTFEKDTDRFHRFLESRISGILA